MLFYVLNILGGHLFLHYLYICLYRHLKIKVSK